MLSGRDKRLLDEARAFASDVERIVLGRYEVRGDGGPSESHPRRQSPRSRRGHAPRSRAKT